MQIATHTVVSLKYKLSNHQSGEQIEITDETNPLVFLFGAGALIPDFENNLKDKNPGDEFDFAIPAANAYGIPNDEEIVVIPANVFHDEKGEFDNKMFQVGTLVPMSDGQGHQMRGKILEITDDVVKMDFNHPLAGTDLHFQGTILEVREATADEIAHGHVHGPHGHHH